MLAHCTVSLTLLCIFTTETLYFPHPSDCLQLAKVHQLNQMYIWCNRKYIDTTEIHGKAQQSTYCVTAPLIPAAHTHLCLNGNVMCCQQQKLGIETGKGTPIEKLCTTREIGFSAAGRKMAHTPIPNCFRIWPALPCRCSCARSMT